MKASGKILVIIIVTKQQQQNVKSSKVEQPCCMGFSHNACDRHDDALFRYSCKKGVAGNTYQIDSSVSLVRD